MKCRKCRGEIPDGSKFCNLCGVKQDVRQNPKSRGNGQGSVYQLPNKSWACVKTIGYETDPDGRTKRKTRSKMGFRTKKEALDYLPNLNAQKPKPITLKQVYEAWLPTHRAGKSTMNNYKAAWKYFAQIENMQIMDITIEELQECVDDCPKGRRTKENMKALCGLIYKYGIPRRITDMNMGEYLIISGEYGDKDGLPMEAVEKIRQNIGAVEGADYVYCLCYLGFRISEFLALDVESYNRVEKAFTGGSKTTAGIDRIVTVSPKIQPIIDRLVNKETGPLFCTASGRRMNNKEYRDMFYDVLERCGIENPKETRNGITYRRYTPHSCRHTFATMLKRISASDKDKLELIGHTSTQMLRKYQDVNYADLRLITDNI